MSAATPPPLRRDDALFLDFDGTLVEIAETPDAVNVPAGLRNLLRATQVQLQGALAIVSGRALADIDRLLGFPLPAAGLHGVEWRADPAAPIERAQTPALHHIAAALKQRFAEDPRVRIEDKSAAVAIHFRAAPERENECIAALRALELPAGTEIILGKKVAEARPASIDKGVAIRRLMTAPLFRERRPVFLGDDVTDEDGFRSVEVLGGVAVKVGLGSSTARYRLQSTAAVHAWMQQMQTPEAVMS